MVPVGLTKLTLAVNSKYDFQCSSLIIKLELLTCVVVLINCLLWSSDENESSATAGVVTVAEKADLNWKQ